MMFLCSLIAREREGIGYVLKVVVALDNRIIHRVNYKIILARLLKLKESML